MRSILSVRRIDQRRLFYCSKTLWNSLKAVAVEDPFLGRRVTEIKASIDKFNFLDVSERAVLSNSLNASNSTELRRGILRLLGLKGYFNDMQYISKSIMVDEQGDFYNDVKLEEFKEYVVSLTKHSKPFKTLELVERFFSQFPLDKMEKFKLINAIFIDIKDLRTPNECLAWWCLALKDNMDALLFSDTEIDRGFTQALNSLLKSRPMFEHYFSSAIEYVLKVQDMQTASESASFLLKHLMLQRNFTQCQTVWKYKVDLGYQIHSVDLTAILASACYFHQWDRVLELYNTYGDAHDNFTQVDYTLIAYAKHKHGMRLLNENNDIPEGSLRHYGVKMFILSEKGDFEQVEELYSELLKRKLKPDHAVILSLVNAHYKALDLNTADRRFGLFEEYDIEPTAFSYLLMLQIYEAKDDYSGCFKILKKMDQLKVPLTEAHITCVINLFARSTNVNFAIELYRLMSEHYGLCHTGLSVSALMNVYNTARMPERAISLFKKYRHIKSVPNKNMIYNSALEAHMLLGNYKICEGLLTEMYEERLPKNFKTYEMILRFLVEYKKQFKSAEKLLKTLTVNEPDTSPVLAEVIIKAYDKMGNIEGALNIVNMLLQNGSYISSRCLYYLAKGAFIRSTMDSRGFSIFNKWIKDLMRKVHSKQIRLDKPILHPGMIAWPIKKLTSYREPVIAADILNLYSKLFLQRASTQETKLVVLKCMAAIAASSGRWEDFEDLFDMYMERIELMKGLHKIPGDNRFLETAMFGIFDYKLQHLKHCGQVTTKLPTLLKDIDRKGLILSNSTWELVLRELFKHRSTIFLGMRITDKYFMIGYTKLLVGRINKNNTSEVGGKKILKVRETKKLGRYVSHSVLKQLQISLDAYLGKSKNRSETIRRLIDRFPYFMKQYLMTYRKGLVNWNEIEEKHKEYLKKLRKTKKRIPGEFF
ncbi:HDL545Wp [Eremothecium sinecaudum]|uniref:Mitochondrial 15S rRNA processing factor CCM1 n=1 Tax=Eremothecium sinecaudum TaxID=45286 RepID=A0A0X8HRP8_9SACH|nr:HDL545Wp [Eremothecium sinecaudum]AMD20199.1 HDL545Wp [Eremothecium sinecaudum]